MRGDSAIEQANRHDGGALAMYLRDVRRVGRCAPDEQPAMAHRAERVRSRSGRGAGRALEALVPMNLRLVISIACRFQGRGLDLADIIQEGNIGLLYAAARFDSSRGCRFSTYATWWIQQAIPRALDRQVALVHVPSSLVARFRQASWRRRMMPSSTPGSGTDDMVSTERLQDLLAAIRETVSLDDPYGPEDGSPLREVLADGATRGPEEIAAFREVARRVSESLGRLSPRERLVLQLRFGLDRAREHSLSEAGRRLSRSRERVRQIEKRALGKLRQLFSRCEVGALLEAARG